MTVIKRRQFIRGGAAGLGLAALGWAGLRTLSAAMPAQNPATAAAGSELLLSACDDAHGQHWLSGWRSDGESLFRLAIPSRAHAVSWHPGQQQAVFYARRPGTQLYVVALPSGELQQQVTSPAGYHFYGHGVFSADGRHLFTTENAYHRGRGVIGIYDSSDYRRIGELDSGGIAPHQLELLSDGHTLVVANGGILTHPDQARENLNPDTMQPSLTYLDSRSGEIIDQFLPQHHQMSIRHLAVSSDDRVVMGVQFQGDASAMLPLVLSHKGEPRLQPMLAGELDWLGQQQYIASVAIDNGNQVALTTSPRGNNVSLWDLRTQRLLHITRVRDVAGAVFSAHSGRFLVSNGLGQVLSIDARQPQQMYPYFARQGVHWDNHLALTS